MKTTTQQPKIGNWLILLIRVDKVGRGGKDQESKQSSTTFDPGYHIGKWQKHNLTSQTRAKRSALSQQVTTWQQ